MHLRRSARSWRALGAIGLERRLRRIEQEDGLLP